jgi:hypothetical protein
MNLIPVTILTGFLGSGETTLLNRILNRSEPWRPTVGQARCGAGPCCGALDPASPGEPPWRSALHRWRGGATRSSLFWLFRGESP